MLSNKRVTKALIRLRGCVGWFVPLLFTNPRRQVFSRRGLIKSKQSVTGPRSTVGNVSVYRCESNCRSRVASLTSARSHTFVEIDHEIIYMVILLPSAVSFMKGCSVTSERMCTNYWLTACSRLPRKKWLSDLTVPPLPQVLTWDVK